MKIRMLHDNAPAWREGDVFTVEGDTADRSPIDGSAQAVVTYAFVATRDGGRHFLVSGRGKNIGPDAVADHAGAGFEVVD